MKNQEFKKVAGFKIQDKIGGFFYKVIGQNKTHYLAIDRMGEEVRVNKTQAVKVS